MISFIVLPTTKRCCSEQRSTPCIWPHGPVGEDYEIVVVDDASTDDTR
jgi:hypothetical protein